MVKISVWEAIPWSFWRPNHHDYNPFLIFLQRTTDIQLDSLSHPTNKAPISCNRVKPHYLLFEVYGTIALLEVPKVSLILIPHCYKLIRYALSC